MPLIDFDDIVDQAHPRHGQDASPNNQSLIRKSQPITNMSDDPTQHR